MTKRKLLTIPQLTTYLRNRSQRRPIEHFANNSVHDVMDLLLQVRYNKRLGFAAMLPPFAFLRQALLVDVDCSCAVL